MIVIPDANSIISALIKRGKALDLFEWNDFKRDIRFIAPENLLVEVRQNISLIVKKSGILEPKILELLNKIESQIEVIPSSKFENFISEAVEVSPPNDFPYVALALYLKSKGKKPIILSNDKELLSSLSKIGVKCMPLHDLLFELKLV